MIESRRLAQIGVFLLGLANLPALILSFVTLTTFADPDRDFDLAGLLIAAGHALFVLSLLLASGVWAALIDASGPSPASRSSGTTTSSARPFRCSGSISS